MQKKLLMNIEKKTTRINAKASLSKAGYCYHNSTYTWETGASTHTKIYGRNNEVRIHYNGSASENGGNCELTKKDEITEFKKVIIDGTSNIPGTMPVHASELYAKNILAFLTHMIKNNELNLDLEDEIISGALFTSDGKITDEQTLKVLEGK